MPEIFKQPWPWYTSGLAIAFVMALLLYFGKSFGFSSNLRTICAIAGAGKHTSFFNYNWKRQRWNLLFMVGAIAGGFICSVFFKNDEPLSLSPATINDLQKLNIPFDGQLNPESLFGTGALDFKNILLLLVGGLLVGFGSRYAGGCTSGHAISGLSALQLPSLIAVVGFFIGGLVMTWLIFPFLF
ncbi:YeeE/YedE family protein [Mucilaginibacter hurinus]|uniref:YeeE/YedE family protein n=1 Tax=Mucilaginibacter hurinus TaxID=2201324 RepID=A0A367GSY5_9SPHI|nr:YeeE/YedE thiosulfate transporter family protein [Mucilaginibacter hurinus]RCH56195.1 YeeE/YedE family protein [Mucilaginibacter hurinus]